MKRTSIALLTVLGLSAIAAQPARPQTPETPQASVPQQSVPRLVQFNGTLKDAWARPVSGVASVSFAIYGEQDGGTALWSETQNVIAESNGHYNAVLGAATANGVPAELFGSGQSRWLGLTIAHQQEMPRVLLASVPYALKAVDAETLGGLPASAYVTTQSLAAISAKSVAPVAPSTTNPNVAPHTGSPTVMPEATPSGGGTTDFIPLWTSGTVLGNSVLFQTGGNVGFNTTKPAGLLDVNGNSLFRGSFQLMPGGTATASSGDSSHSMQWNASVYNSSTKTAQNLGLGFRAIPENNNTSIPAAALELFYGPGGGTLTDIGFGVNSVGEVTVKGIPVIGEGYEFQAMLQATAPPVPSDTGLNGLNGLEGDGGSPDGSGEGNVGGFGVVGMGGGGASGLNSDGSGGFFRGGSNTASGGDGIVAEAGSGIAGEFEGDISINGTEHASVVQRKIDHPADPANKYLVHAAVQSSEMMNMYTGNVVLDADGAAVVQLPGWFQAENADFRYSLSAVGAPAPNLYVAEEVSGNQFKVAGGRAGQKISWYVTAIPQDVYAKANPLVVEEVKKPKEQGYYMNPELYGQAEEKGLKWARHPQMMKRMKATREKQMALVKASGTAEAQPAPRAN
jgi:hypothetical protein